MSATVAKDNTRCVGGGQSLKQLRTQMGLSQADLARQMATPLRTVQDWEAGRRPVSGLALVAARLLVERDRWVMQAVIEKVQRDVARDWPNGISGEGHSDD